MQSQETVKKQRWLHLQGIRGLAILSVIGFHFYPKYFPNGYLGVDQFFVLSGFLMCMLLKRSENLPIFSLITLFYSKRFKRILPLYLLVICCSLIALYTVFPDTAIETNIISASKAVLFTSNRPKTDQEDYFQMLSIAVDIFTHTWSLSVEVQYYFIVPLIFIIANRFSYQLITYSFIGVMSFLFYICSDDVQAFNSVFSRTWQFLIGHIAYLYTSETLSTTREDISYLPLCGENEKLIENSNESDEKGPLAKSKSNLKLRYSILLLMLCFILCPLTAPVIIARPTLTILTGILIPISMDDYFLSNKLLTYFGDISYSLYLIHWPIYSYWKLILDNNHLCQLNFKIWKMLKLLGLIFSLFASIALAAIVFGTFEKWYLQLSSTNICILVVIFLIPINIMINYDLTQQKLEDHLHFNTTFDGVGPNMTLYDAKRFNRRWNIENAKTLTSSTCEYQDGNGPLGWCVHKGLNKNNKYKMVIFGNSWAANHATLFYQECGYKSNYILQGSSYGCEPLYPTQNFRRCWSNLTDFEAHLAEAKPDIGFLFTRFMSLGDPFKENVTKMQDDPIYNFMKNQTMKLLKNIKNKLYILNAIPQIKSEGVKDIVRNLRANLSISEIDRGLVDLSHYEMARARYAELIKDCGDKCELIDYFNEFYDNSTSRFRYFDRNGFSYFTSSNHLTPHGLEKVRHIYRDLCKNL